MLAIASATPSVLAACPAYDGNAASGCEPAAGLARPPAGLPLMAINDVLYHVARAAPAAGRADRDPPHVPLAEAGFGSQAMPSAI